MKIKSILRKFLGIKPEETVADGLQRHYYHFEKKLPHEKITRDQLKNYLIQSGIKPGDVLIVHASWRALYMLDMSPVAVIELLIELLGTEGTLLMPSYGIRDNEFNTLQSPSAAGVLSECFRKYPGTLRSCFPKFSMCAHGKYAKEILSEHQKSLYQFDEHSPYYIATKKYHAKILLLGMGRHPHKISVFHCASYSLRDTIDYYKNCYSYKKTSYVISSNTGGGGGGYIDYLDRLPVYQNNKAVFRKLFRSVPQRAIHKSKFNMIVFDAGDAYDVALEFCKKGGKLYCKRE